VVCSDIYPGTVVTLTPTPAGANVFLNWTGDCSGAGACVVTVDQARNVGAVFGLGPQTLTVAIGGTGTGTVTSVVVPVINCPGTCSQTYPVNTVVTLTATPAVGSSFTGWSGAVPACAGTGTCTVTMSQAQNVTANFSLPTFPLTVNKAGFGTGGVVSNPIGISCLTACTTANFGFVSGTSVVLTATADAGKTFTSFSGGGCTTSPCTVVVTAATTVTATFGDVQAPTVAITGQPTDPSNSANPTFTFTADESPVTFTCKLDTGAPFTCTSPTTLTVGNGVHTFSVFATDPAGNVSNTASFTWTAAGIVISNVPIPTLNEWMLVLLALVLGSAGILARRRKG